MPDVATQIPALPPPLALRLGPVSMSDDPESQLPPLSSYERRRLLMEEMAARARYRHDNRPYRRTLGLPWYGWAITISGMCFLLFMGLWGIKKSGVLGGERDGLDDGAG